MTFVIGDLYPTNGCIKLRFMDNYTTSDPNVTTQ